MKTIPVSLKERSYQIIVGSKMLPELPRALKKLNLGTDAVIVTNPLVGHLYGKNLANLLVRQGFGVKTFCVPDSEKAKSSQVALEIINKIAAYDLQKKIFVIALGGGVVGDLSGFVSAIYKRGIPYIQVPTSFLAQIDSAIGGKTGIDLSAGKNLVGAFNQPRLVFSDVSFLKTLNQRQIKNGLAEAVKYGVIVDPQLFSFIEKNADELLAGNLKFLTPVIERSSQIKARVVTIDEKETKGLRMILNFGHTLGHAIEAAGGYDVYQHGEAIGLGMQMACDLSVEMKMLKEKDSERIKILIRRLGLPTELKRMNVAKVLEKMRHDKKFQGKTNRFILAEKIGRVKAVTGISPVLIKKVVRAYL